ncbi:MAG: vWA domain-containing protein, partial [Elusimicrobiota bacterium]
MQSKKRYQIVHKRQGLQIDPIAFFLKKVKQFVKRIKISKTQTTAAATLIDFSGSMSGLKEQLAYAIAAVGDSFWKLKQAAPESFFYDLSSFTDTPVTVIGMDENFDEAANAHRLVAMANQIGNGGTDIYGSMKKKYEDFIDSRNGRSAKVKYMVVFTDGADSNTVVREG